LRDRLNKLLEELKNRGFGQNQQGKPGQQGQGQGDMNDLGRAGEAMSEAESSLGEATPTAPSTRKGARSMPCARARRVWRNRCSSRWDKVPVPAAAAGSASRAQQDTDPLGRPLRGREYGDDYTVKVPGEIDVQRARRIIEELRRRFGDVLRPQEELDYIERLLKDY
jgi:hypothetical protein